MELLDSLVKLYTKLLSLYNNNMRKVVEESSNELSFASINYLEVIASKEQITSSELAKIMQVSKPAVTSIIDSLITKGYVEKKQSELDKRVFYLTTTLKYREYRNPGIKLTAELIAKLGEKLTEEELDVLEKAITEIADIL